MTKINDILQDFKAKLSKLFDLGIRGKRKKLGSGSKVLCLTCKRLVNASDILLLTYNL